MQREKLYNLHKTTYFIAALFSFKMDKILSNQISAMEKDNVFDTQRMHSCYFIVSSPILGFIKRKRKYTARCSVKSSTIYTVKIIVNVFRKRKILCDEFPQCPKFAPSKLCPFWKQKVPL
jgi:hypothetical protein